MVLLFYVYYFLIFSPSKDIIDDAYAYLQTDLNIKYYGDLNKYIGIDLNHFTYG